MHSKSCCALFLLALVACQAAPSSKIIEKKSISETETNLAEENLQLEDTGEDKDRAKKSTTFCVELRSGKEEVVPCKNQEQKLPVLNVKTPEFKPYTFVQTAPVSAPQYPVSNVLIQPLQPQPQPQVVVQPNVFQVPQPAPQFIHVQAQPQQPSVVEPAPQKSQQTVIPVATAPAPTPIINIIPAPVSAPCEHSPKPQQPQPPQQQIHTVHIVQPPQQQETPLQPPKPQIKPQEPKPVLQKVEVVPVAQSPCKSEVIIAPPPLEYYYREEEPTRVVEYLEAPQQEYECSCRSEQNLKARPYKHHVKLYPSEPVFRMKGPSIDPQKPSASGNQGIIFAAREAEARHHKKKQPVQLTVQPLIYNAPNYPLKYDEPNSYQSYRPVYIKPTNPVKNYESYSNENTYLYPVSNYESYSKENTPYSNVPLVTVNAGGPFYRNSQDSRENLENTSSQEALSNINDISNNQKREANSIQLKNDEQGETTEALKSTDVENIYKKEE